MLHLFFPFLRREVLLCKNNTVMKKVCVRKLFQASSDPVVDSLDSKQLFRCREMKSITFCVITMWLPSKDFICLNSALCNRLARVNFMDLVSLKSFSTYGFDNVQSAGQAQRVVDWSLKNNIKLRTFTIPNGVFMTQIKGSTLSVIEHLKMLYQVELRPFLSGSILDSLQHLILHGRDVNTTLLSEVLLSCGSLKSLIVFTVAHSGPNVEDMEVNRSIQLLSTLSYSLALTHLEVHTVRTEFSTWLVLVVPHCHALKVLNLNDCTSVTIEEVVQIMECDCIPHLTALCVVGIRAIPADFGAAAVSRCRGLRVLQLPVEEFALLLRKTAADEDEGAMELLLASLPAVLDARYMYTTELADDMCAHVDLLQIVQTYTGRNAGLVRLCMLNLQRLPYTMSDRLDKDGFCGLLVDLLYLHGARDYAVTEACVDMLQQVSALSYTRRELGQRGVCKALSNVAEAFLSPISTHHPSTTDRLRLLVVHVLCELSHCRDCLSMLSLEHGLFSLLVHSLTAHGGAHRTPTLIYCLCALQNIASHSRRNQAWFTNATCCDALTFALTTFSTVGAAVSLAVLETARRLCHRNGAAQSLFAKSGLILQIVAMLRWYATRPGDSDSENGREDELLLLEICLAVGWLSAHRSTNNSVKLFLQYRVEDDLQRIARNSHTCYSQVVCDAASNACAHLLTASLALLRLRR